MSLPQLEKFFFHVSNDPLRRELYDQDIDTLLKGYDLTEEEVRAVKSVDVTALFQMEVEPLLLQPFAALHDINGPDLFAACSKASNWDNRKSLGLAE